MTMGEAKRKSELIAAATREMEHFVRPISLELNITQMMGLAGVLQVALRHPQIARRPSANFAAELIRNVIKSLPEDMPATKRLMAMGFHSRFDESIETSEIKDPAQAERHGPG